MWAAGLLLPALLLGGAVGCGAEEEPPATPAVVQADPAAAIGLLSDFAEAVTEGDTEKGPWPAHVVANAAEIGVSDFSVRYLSDEPGASASLPEGQWAATVDLSWQFDSFDPTPARAEVGVVFSGDGEELRLESIGGGRAVRPLWLTETVAVEKRDDVLVLVAGEQQEKAGRYAALAQRGLRATRRILGDAVSEQSVVVEVPTNATALEQALAVESGAYESIAAVTTTVDATNAPGSPVHVFVNDPVFGKLGNHGAQVVMTHEIVHLATDAATEGGVPLWLVEGFADWVALRGSDIPLTQSASQLIAQIKADGLPEGVPGEDEFSARASHLGAAYEAAWLLVSVLAERGGAEPLLDLQRRLSDGEDLDGALEATHDLDEAELVELWRAKLSKLIR